MLLPTDLLPEKLGLVWGAAFEEPQPPALSGGSDSERWTYTDRAIDGVEYGVSLHFDALGLGHISVVTHVSRDFWEEREEGDIEAVWDEYQSICDSLILATAAILGVPNLARKLYTWGDATTKIQDADIEEIWLSDNPQNSPIYDKWLGGMDGPEAIWKRKEARFQIGLMKQDTELPYEITVSAMRPDDIV